MLANVQVVVERSRVKSLLAVVGCLVFVVASLAIVAEGSAVTLVVGAVGFLTFAGFGVGWLVLLFRRGPGLVVDDDGFDDHSSAVAVGRVPWTDVTSVNAWGVFGSSFVGSRCGTPRTTNISSGTTYGRAGPSTTASVALGSVPPCASRRPPAGCC